MIYSPFSAYYLARKLEKLSDDEGLIPVFASSDICIYPFQIAAARFALRSPYQKGCILCDESGMGKSHEAMMILTQRWYEGKNRLLLAIPSTDLLSQWVELIEQHYTIPYVVLKSSNDLISGGDVNTQNPFLQNALVIATYDFLVERETLASTVSWDLAVFEEATALFSVYIPENKKAKALKRIVNDSCKILLTGTPIEKNIMDLYGLIYFIDETILPNEQEFLRRYLRRPENYPELADKVSKYCFRTLRVQAKDYAKIPNRIPITYEYTSSKKEKELYDRLFAYCQREHSIAFPEMNPYDLCLRLLGIFSSSTAAIAQTIDGIIERIQSNPSAIDETHELEEIQEMAKSITQDTKTAKLLEVLDNAFKRLKQVGAPQKALIFTESTATQNYLYPILAKRYHTVLYNGSMNYSAIQSFKKSAKILLSTDLGARGFNLEECSFVVQYDLLYNTLKMEQRIDRCHRLGQKHDVFVFSFIDKNNFSDVRKLELVNKRILVADGVLGLSDEVVGGFTDNLDTAFAAFAQNLRTSRQVEKDYMQTLVQNEATNKKLVSSAQEMLFTTFTRQLADKLKIAPNYIEERAAQITEDIWQLTKWFFAERNKTHDDCFFVIDDKEKTITAQAKGALPTLFYYWTGSQNKKYHSQKAYGMAKSFKPKHGKITLASIIGRGIIHEIECADSGTLTVDADIRPCQIALFLVEISAEKRLVQTVPVLIGKTEDGEILTPEQCEDILALPVVGCTQDGHASAAWLRSSSKPGALDCYVPVESMLKKQGENLSEVQAEEVERIKNRVNVGKSELAHVIDDLQAEVKRLEKELQNATGDRLKTITLQRQITQKRQELLKKQDSQFFEAMQLDIKIEKQVNEFLRKEKLTAKVIRQFVVEVGGTKR